MVAEPKDRSAEVGGRTTTGPLVLVTLLFFLWGFVTSLNNVLVPHFKDVFGLSYGTSALVPVAFFSAYLLVSIPAGILVGRLGYPRGIAGGLWAAAMGALLFYPAAGIPSYPLFLAGLFILAGGIAALQVAANPYVTALGQPETAPSRLNMTQGFNALGTTLAPYLGGMWLFSSHVANRRLVSPGGVRIPYLVIGLLLLALAIPFRFLQLPALPTIEAAPARARSFLQALRVRRLRLGVLAIFLYVGAEVAIGSFVVDWFVDPTLGGVRPEVAARWASAYWAGAMIGRFVGAGMLRGRRAGHVLGAAAVAAAALVTSAVVVPGVWAGYLLVSVGLFNSIMFPTIFSLAIAGLGELTSCGSSLLVTAIVGGAWIPLLVGGLADRIGLHHALVLLVPCYATIAGYGYWGTQPNR